MSILFHSFFHHSVSKRALAFVLVSLLGVTTSALAGSGISVSVSTGSISATATVGGVDGMLLRVGGPGDFFAETRSDGSSVNWSLPGTAPDGNYRYEVNASAGSTSYRATGRFSVSGGQISEQKLRKSEYAPGLWHAAADMLSHFGETVLNVLVPVAQAQDAEIISNAPTAFFDDTSNGTGDDWEILGLAGADGLGLGPIFAFGIFDDNGDTLPIEIDSTSLNDLSFFSDTNGDVSFGNDAVFVDRDAVRLGVGTITPTSSLHVMKSDGTAQVLVEETKAVAGPQNMFELRNNGPVGFNMLNTDSNVRWRFAAQVDGFRVNIADAGDAGPEMTVFETGALQVGKNGTQQLFLDASGNLTIQGTLTEMSDVAAKEGFATVDGQSILARLQDLPITQWRYKKDTSQSPHLGPMAQDFYSAFGLGSDDKHISPRDVASVALVGVKELHKMIEVRDAEIAEQQTEIAALKKRLAVLEARDTRVEALEAAVSKLLADRPAHLVSLAQ